MVIFHQLTPLLSSFINNISRQTCSRDIKNILFSFPPSLFQDKIVFVLLLIPRFRGMRNSFIVFRAKLSRTFVWLREATKKFLFSGPANKTSIELSGHRNLPKTDFDQIKFNNLFGLKEPFFCQILQQTC